VHVAQVGGDLKKDWRAEAGCHGLSDIHVAGDNHAVGGGGDGAAVQFSFGPFKGMPPHAHLGFGLVQCGTGLVYLRGGDELLGTQFLHPLPVHAGEFESGLGRFQLRPGRADGCCKSGRIDLCDHLPPGDARVKIHHDILDDARNLASDGHFLYGLQCPVRHDTPRYFTAVHLYGVQRRQGGVG